MTCSLSLTLFRFPSAATAQHIFTVEGIDYIEPSRNLPAVPGFTRATSFVENGPGAAIAGAVSGPVWIQVLYMDSPDERAGVIRLLHAAIAHLATR